MGIITVSRQQGSGGSEIAARVSEILGYRYFDQQMLAEAMAQEGLTDQTIIDYREEEYRLEGFMDRLLGYRRPKTIVDAGFWQKDPDAVKTPVTAVLDEHMAVWLVRKAIEDAYKRGNVVIVGRGGQAILGDKPGALHVRIQAPVEMRIQRITERMQLGAKEARQFIQERDRASAEYLRRFYGVDWADPTLYHLVLNMGRWEREAAAQCIVSALKNLEPAPAAAA